MSEFVTKLVSIPTSLPTTFTTLHGECPPSDRLLCPDYCDAIQACASVERGRCLYPIDDDNGFQISGGDSAQSPVAADRQLFCITIRIQNCTGQDMKLSSAQLSLARKLIGIDSTTTPGTNQEIVIGLNGDGNQFNTDKDDRVIADSVAGSPTFLDVRLLSLTSTCGDVNPGYTAGLTPDTGSASDQLFTGATNVPPGECCIKVVLAVTISRGNSDGERASNIGNVLLESACLCIRGRQSLGGACCRWKRSLLLPADCSLRIDRATMAPPDQP